MSITALGPGARLILFTLNHSRMNFNRRIPLRRIDQLFNDRFMDLTSNTYRQLNSESCHGNKALTVANDFYL